MIVAMGFTATNDDHYAFTGEMLTLKKGNRALDKALEPMQVARMTPEERTKHELLQRQNAAYRVTQLKEKERMDEQRRMQQADR